MPGDAPEEMMKIMLNGMEVTIRVAGEAGIGLARILAQYAKRELDRKQADSPLIRLLRSGEDLQMTVIPKERYPEFRRLAGTELLYAPVRKIGNDSEITAVFSGKQAGLLRSILWQMDEAEREEKKQAEKAKKKQEPFSAENREPEKEETRSPRTEPGRRETEPRNPGTEPERDRRGTRSPGTGPERENPEKRESPDPAPERKEHPGNGRQTGSVVTGSVSTRRQTAPRTGPEAGSAPDPAGTAGLPGRAEPDRKEPAGGELLEVVREINRRREERMR